MKKIKVVANKCTGCHLCELACSFKHFGVFNPEYARIKISSDEATASHKHTKCMQCKNAPCIDVCPVNALYKDEETGATMVIHEKCIGCEACVEACPFNAIKWIVADEDGQINVCNLCGGDPECVKVCYDKAIRYE